MDKPPVLVQVTLEVPVVEPNRVQYTNVLSALAVTGHPLGWTDNVGVLACQYKNVLNLGQRYNDHVKTRTFAIDDGYGNLIHIFNCKFSLNYFR